MNLLEHRFFRHFPPEHALRLAKVAKRVSFPARRMIFDEGDPSDAIYLILSGRVEVLKHSSGDHYHMLAFANEDDYFGEVGVLDGSGRSARIVTQTPVRAARVPGKAFLEVLAQCPWETTMALFRHVSRDLRMTNDRFVQAVIRREKITLIGEMANSILHDFRSPVTSIRLALDSVAKRAADPVTHQSCEIIGRQLRRMSSMVEEVLQYARGESRLDRRPVSVRELFANLVALNAHAVQANGITIRIRAASITVLLDHDRMIRVLQNLVSNAIEAIGPNAGGCITLAATRRSGACEITVRDNGPGIPRAIWNSLFQPFTTHGKKGGTGLGLAIAKGIVEAHGGEITFEARRGAGTIFRIRLPIPA